MEERFHRPEHTVRAEIVAGLEQGQQPLPRRRLVVVDEGDKVTARVLDGLIPRQRNVLARLYAVADRDGRRGREVRDYFLRGPVLIVIGNDDRIRK